MLKLHDCEAKASGNSCKENLDRRQGSIDDGESVNIAYARSMLKPSAKSIWPELYCACDYRNMEEIFKTCGRWQKFIAGVF